MMVGANIPTSGSAGRSASYFGREGEAVLRECAASAPEQILERLSTSMAGLRTVEAARRLEQFGPNTFERPAQGSLSTVLRAAGNPLNALLLGMAVLSVSVGNMASAIIIAVMIVLSVSLAFLQEHRSSHAVAALRRMVHVTVSVNRIDDEGSGAEIGADVLAQARDIPLEQVVPGDIVHLVAGDMVPADVRLLSSKDLFVNQASVTGESMPAEKHSACTASTDVEVPRLSNICFMGTTIVSGAGVAVVIHTGTRAVFGSIAMAATEKRPPTSFDRGISRFTWLMIAMIAVMAPLVFLINGLTKGNWLEALIFAMAVAVGLTPEMLPSEVTINLAKGALAMSRKRVIVRRLDAIQNFGAMDVLCTDKTGTLTQDRVILERHVGLDGNESDKVLDYAYLNSYYQTGLKNLLDVAILEYTHVHSKLHSSGGYRKIDEMPFDFVRRRMSVVIDGPDGRVLICKGAADELFDACAYGEHHGTQFPLDEEHRAELTRQRISLNEDGLRLVAVAYTKVDPTRSTYSPADERDLTLLGYVAFLDPPKDSARAAIEALASHGVEVKILTGDNEVVAKKICREVGLAVTGIMLGSQLERLQADELDAQVATCQVFARLAPLQKAQIIASLRRRGHVVGYLGDGINDGPALRSADVGVSVDTAVDIARDSADIVLLEKSLLVLDDGVIEGRKVFANILKYLRMGASSNFGNMFSVLGASAWLPFLPMAPLQVLTNNLLYDFSQVAIPTDHVDAEFVTAPRRWEIRDIARFILYIGPISSVFDYITFGIMFFLFHADSGAQASLFQSGWFTESLLSQTLIIHIIRTSRTPFIESRPSWPLIGTTITICVVGIWLPFSPLSQPLGLTRLPQTYWPLLVLVLVAYGALTFFMKRWLHRRFGLA